MSREPSLTPLQTAWQYRVQATSRSSELSRSRITITLGCSETIRRGGCAFVIETAYGRLREDGRSWSKAGNGFLIPQLQPAA